MVPSHGLPLGGGDHDTEPKTKKTSRQKAKLGLPDLEHAKAAVLVSLRSPESQRSYRRSIDDFVRWYCSKPRLSFNKTVVNRFRIHLEDQQLPPGTVNVRLAATLKGIRDRAILAVLLACGLRRSELIELKFDHLQRREDHWAIADLVGKAGHIRTVPMPDWVKRTVDDWLTAAAFRQGKLFRCVCWQGSVWGTEITEKLVWHVVKEYARRLGVSKLAPHDLRQSCARLCHSAGGELEQIQFLLGHVSVQTTEKYLGCKQRLREAVNDQIGIEPRT
jgi:integrase